MEGFRLNEVLLFHRPSRTLILTDLCFHIQQSSSPLTRAFFRANDRWRRFGPSRIIRNVAISDREAFRRYLERMEAWDFDRIIPGRGDLLEGVSPTCVREAWPG